MLLKDISICDVIDFSKMYKINGLYTSYAWKTTKGATLINMSDYIVTNGITSFLKPQNDSIYGELSNNAFPGLALKTSSFFVSQKTCPTYNIIYDTQGGNAVSSITANYNSTITAPASPAKVGYSFAGWYKEVAYNNAWNFTTDKVTANITLYAKWTINAYTVTFDTQGGNTISGIIANYNSTITTPTEPAKIGYTFAGWYKEAACNNAWDFTNDKVTANTTLFTKWILSTAIFNNKISDLSIYPIPAKDYIIVNGYKMDKICIYNLGGSIAIQIEIGGKETVKIDVSMLKVAYYLISVTGTDHQISNFKMLKE